MAAHMLTKDYLLAEYGEKKASCSDIARACGCNRQFVHKMLKLHKIPRRDLGAARRIALDQRRITACLDDGHGGVKSVMHQRIHLNTGFFSTWSREMGYVLGVLYTDGCLHISRFASASRVRRVPMLSVAQKEPELLNKVLALMDCDAKLRYRPRHKYGAATAGAVYYFSLQCAEMLPDLVRLGMKPRKSLDVDFPDVPDEFMPHFIRGCWDGDGSVYFERKQLKQIRASFVSGSKRFIDGMVAALQKAGLPPRTIYVRPGKTPSYYFRFERQHCMKLFHFLYDGVLPTQYLERKYLVFKQYCMQYEKAPPEILQEPLF